MFGGMVCGGDMLGAIAGGCMFGAMPCGSDMLGGILCGGGDMFGGRPTGGDMFGGRLAGGDMLGTLVGSAMPVCGGSGGNGAGTGGATSAGVATSAGAGTSAGGDAPFPSCPFDSAPERPSSFLAYLPRPLSLLFPLPFGLRSQIGRAHV